MRFSSTALLVVAALALGACNNPDRYAAGNGAGAGAGAGDAGIGTGTLGDVNDPKPIPYFNQSVGDRVFFAVDQTALSSDAQATLTAQAAWLNQHLDYDATIEGHADEQGTREYNLALGARRASGVQQFLVSQGVTASRLRTLSYGKERPVATCSNESCYSQNRRAVTALSIRAGNS